MDFVSILYDNKIEYDLLKLQLYSFRFVDESIINNIYLLFNDEADKNKKFEEEYLSSIEGFVPIHLKSKIEIIYITDLISLDKPYISDWFSQQFAKIYVSRIVKSSIYIVLDVKCIFIRPINKNTFFIDGKIKLYNEGLDCDKMVEFYKNCFNYFGIDNYESYRHSDREVTCSPPFTFITQECKKLVQYVEDKENMNLYDFFNLRKYTEAYFYFAWLCFTNNKRYDFVNEYHKTVIIGPLDPKIYEFNSWKYKIEFINNNEANIICIHRKCIDILDNNYKNNIIEFINNLFKNSEIDTLLRNLLFH